MNAHAKKTQEHRGQSMANVVSKKQSGRESTFQFADNRPETITQRRLQEMVNNSPRVKQLMAFQNVTVRRNYSGVVQRVLTYKGNQYKSMQDLAKSTDGAYDVYMKSEAVGKKQKLTDKKNIYNLEDDRLGKVEGSVEKTEKELRNEFGVSKSKEIKLEKRIDNYPKGATLYAPINKAILVINEGKYKFVGTSGLIGCVEVMIECHTDTDKGYLVAHVSSEIDDNENEIRRQLGVMLGALSDHMNQKIDWSDFKSGSTTHKLTLVRSAKLGEQKLLINISNILAESGAEMKLVNSNSASMEITVLGAKYYDNQPEGLQKPPTTDYRTTKGYPFPEKD